MEASASRQLQRQHAALSPRLGLLPQQVQRAGMRVVPAIAPRQAHAAVDAPHLQRARIDRVPRMALDHGKPQAQQREREGGVARLASTLRRPPRWPSTSSPIRRCSLCEKPAASAWATMYAPWRW